MIQKLKHRYRFESKIIKKGSPDERTDFTSSSSQMFFKIGALKNFENFTGKHQCWVSV